jgi:hypothetical protein
MRVVGCTMAHDFPFPDQAGDAYLIQRFRRLADRTLPRPLLTLSDDNQWLRGSDVHLTQDADDVLAERANAVEWNGIDDWVGGVHLDSRSGHVWFRKDQTLVQGHNEPRRGSNQVDS